MYQFQTSGTKVYSSYDYQTKYLNYGGRYYYNNDSTDWSYQGSSSYKGNSVYDTVSYQYSGSQDFSDTTTYQYGKDSYSYKSIGQSTYDQKGSVMPRNDYWYQSGDDYYQSTVTVPLVSDFSCNSNAGIGADIMVRITYVSGRETITYRQGGQEGTFEIDYGNGECDNKITIIENGNVIVVDLSKDWPVLTASVNP